ncbi:AraC family transcriptional regulator [Aquimarina sp. MMG015]|uniref:helix-turn-helix domain-containing protein n=1 Tax=Aquimarina sp. MMG015 TaxID=2822689 RepID=UPI001B3A158F|nr:helix-turn-helix domain-containing protein [Aquimarina sp. MMG015]MBQ4803333.1 AraC family transcriptional regulator [Aquimarina sp. MMG015]
MRNEFSFLILLLFFVNILCANQIQKQDSLSILYSNKIKSESNEFRKKSLANQYLNLVKQNNNVAELAEAYYTLSEIFSHSEDAVKYSDSIIQVSQNLKDKAYLAKGYLQKGIQLYYVVEYNEALKNYLKANEYYSEQKDEFKQLIIRHYIGLLKSKIHENNEAFNIFKENMSFFKKLEHQEKHKKQYLKSLFAISNAYILNKRADSAQFYSKKGIQVSSDTEDKYLYPLFLLSYGSAKLIQKEYKIALDSMIKGTSLIEDKKISLAMNYIHISSIYDSINDKTKSIYYLDKVDSTYKKSPQVILQARDAYEALFKKYEDNAEKQLEIIKKLLSVDSILKTRPTNLSKQIAEQYDTPKLISEKEKLITKLETEKKTEKLINWFLVLFVLILSAIIIYVGRRNLINKKRFKILLENLNEHAVKKNSTHPKEKSQREDIDLPSEVVDTILSKLDKFERSNQFVTKQYTLSLLAKELNTNNGYLSKIINAKKKTSFSQYINNLRIDYAVTRLTEDSKLRSYTIKAIAKEFGFNTAQSFTTAFHKNTGIYPSYFLKNLKNKIAENR